MTKCRDPPTFFTHNFFYENGSEWPKMDFKHNLFFKGFPYWPQEGGGVNPICMFSLKYPGFLGTPNMCLKVFDVCLCLTK